MTPLLLFAALSADRHKSLVAHVNRSELRQRFESAFSRDHKFVGDHFAKGPHGVPYWCVKFEPKKPGFYIVRYDITLKNPRPYDRQTVSYEFYISVGKRGSPRMMQANRAAFPTACVGDTVVVPINVSGAITEHSFTSNPNNPNTFKVISERHRENSAAAKAGGRKWQLAGKLPTSLSLHDARTRSSRNRSGATIHRSFFGSFRTTQPDEMTLHTVVNGKLSKPGVLIRILPKEKSLTVYPSHGATIKKQTRDGRTVTISGGASGWLQLIPEFPRTVVRVGDVVSTGVWGDQFPTTEPKPVPRIAFQRKEYVVPKSVFERLKFKP